MPQEPEAAKRRSYVVKLIGSDDPDDLKHFESRQSAQAYARKNVEAGDAERADIYEVIGAANAYAAATFVDRGDAELLESRTMPYPGPGG